MTTDYTFEDAEHLTPDDDIKVIITADYVPEYANELTTEEIVLFLVRELEQFGFDVTLTRKAHEDAERSAQENEASTDLTDATTTTNFDYAFEDAESIAHHMQQLRPAEKKKYETMLGILHDEIIPKKLSKAKSKDLILAFEAWQKMQKKYKKIYTLEEYVAVIHPDRKPRCDEFFKRAIAAIRKAAEASPRYDENLKDINADTFAMFPYNKKYMSQKREKTLHPFLTFSLAHAAYQHTLDHYDPNIHDNLGLNWLGFWSLIKTTDGVVSNVSLFDTFDLDLFWGYVRDHWQDFIWL